jgi:cation-transporting ATPase 13A3/4/5
LPSGALISVPVLSSVIGSIAIQLAFQVFMFYNVTWWEFYTPPGPVDPDDADDNTAGYQNTSVFLISLYQYVVVCVAFSISKPFRQPLYTNLWFTASLILLTVFNIYITVANEDWIYSTFQVMQGISLEFRLFVLLMAVVNGAITFFYEKIAIWYISIWWKNRKEKKMN